MPAPAAAQFSKALEIVGRPRGRQLKFLQRHYAATGRAMTMTRLAQAAGYRGYRGVNLHYGLLANRIGRVLGREPGPVCLSLLAQFVQPRAISNQEYLLIMRPSFAKALKAQGWVK